MQVLCPKCSSSLPRWHLAASRNQTPCPVCLAPVGVEIFPAFFKAAEPIAIEALGASEGEARCYLHAGKRAVDSCHCCGCFVCGLCEVKLGGQTWCPVCLGGGVNKAVPVQQLGTTRTLFDSIALALALWPFFLLFYLSVLSAPVVLYIVIRYWKRPSSIIPRNKWRFIVAAVFAGLELAGAAAFIIVVILATRRRFTGQ